MNRWDGATHQSWTDSRPIKGDKERFTWMLVVYSVLAAKIMDENAWDVLMTEFFCEEDTSFHSWYVRKLVFLFWLAYIVKKHSTYTCKPVFKLYWKNFYQRRYKTMPWLTKTNLTKLMVKNVQAATKNSNIRPLHADSYIYTSGKEIGSNSFRGHSVPIVLRLRVRVIHYLFPVIPYILRNIWYCTQ